MSHFPEPYVIACSTKHSEEKTVNDTKDLKSAIRDVFSGASNYYDLAEKISCDESS